MIFSNIFSSGFGVCKEYSFEVTTFPSSSSDFTSTILAQTYPISDILHGNNLMLHTRQQQSLGLLKKQPAHYDAAEKTHAIKFSRARKES